MRARGRWLLRKLGLLMLLEGEEIIKDMALNLCRQACKGEKDEAALFLGLVQRHLLMEKKLSALENI